MAVIREHESIGSLGAGSIIDTLGLTDVVNQMQQSLSTMETKLGTMADTVTDSMPLVNVTLVIVTISLGSIAIFAFLDFMDMNPFRRK